MGGRHLGDGHAAQRHHDDRHDRAGLQRRHALRAVLLRAAGGDDHPVGDAGPVLLQLGRLHGVRVSRETVRREDPQLHQPAVPALARHVVRRGRRRACRRAVAGARPGPDRDLAADRDARRGLHDVRRRAGGHLDRRQDHGPGRLLPVRRHRRGRRRLSVRRQHHRRPQDRWRNRTAADVRLQLRPDQPVHLLVGHDRRAVPVLLVLRHRPEPGAALSHRPVRQRGAQLAADECLLEDPDAGPRAPARRARVRVSRVQRAAAALQQRSRRAIDARGSRRLCGAPAGA